MIPIVAGLLMGAAMGGGIAALQGKDVLKGALMGGAGGALGGVLMPAAGGIMGGEAAAGIGGEALGAGLGTPEILGGAGEALTSTATQATASGAGTGGMFSDGIGGFLSQNKGALMGGAVGGMMAPGEKPPSPDQGDIREFEFNPGERNPLFGQPGQNYYTGNRGFTEGAVIPVEDYNKANGGIIALAEGGQADRYSRPVRTLDPSVAAYNAQLMERANQQYNVNARPGPNQVSGFDFQPSQPTTVTTEKTENKGFVPSEGSIYAGILAEKKRKEDAKNALPEVDNYNFSAGDSAANGGRITQRYNEGGLSSLGSYSDGGQLLKGPGDGVSDSIPARIGSRQPARLADGEFVVPARIVSELGNGSTDAGAKRLYAMMDRVQKNRKKSIGKGKVAVDSKAHRMLPA